MRHLASATPIGTPTETGRARETGGGPTGPAGFRPVSAAGAE
jgi:hypothetical protein